MVAVFDRNLYPVWHGFAHPNFGVDVVPLVSGRGCWVTDARDRSYLNAFSGLSLILGVGRAEIESAIVEQLKALPYAHGSRGTTRAAIEAASAILEMFPGEMEMRKVMFSVSGAEAVEGAMKIARQYHRIRGAPRNIVLGFNRSYHGSSFGAVSVSGAYIDDATSGFGPLLNDTRIVGGPETIRNCGHCRQSAECTGACASDLEQAIAELGPGRIAAVIVEPVLGAGGVIVPSAAFVQRLTESCRASGILLIVDESATGCGRTGKMLGSEHFELAGDIVVLSKALNAGYLPTGAIVCNRAIFEAFAVSGARVAHGASQAGNPACVAAIATTLRIVREEQIPARAAARGERLMSGISALDCGEAIIDIRGIGLMIAIEVDSSQIPLERLEHELMQAGVLAHLGGNRVGLFPPLTISEAEVDFMIEALGNSINRVRRQ